ncbi:MAG: thiol reductant exporter subunit CydD [Actinomycetota bacterium]
MVVNPETANPLIAIIAAAIKALTIIGQEWFSSIAATKVKSQLRMVLLDRVTSAGENWRNEQSKSELSLLLTSGLDSLDAYFAKFLPQIVYTILAAPIYVFVIFSQDSLSGITVLATMPLIPLFMIFIGWATEQVQTRQLRSLTALSHHFSDAVRGLTTLRVFGRAKAQSAIMLENSEQHRKRTMKVLSISFLSGFALELIASLAVALVAVSIGLRLIDGSITLAAGLLVLVLAPDAYLPLRMIGANFHASADGIAAIERTFALLDAPANSKPAALVKLKPTRGKLTVVTGVSGAGKTTALKALISKDAAWMPQGSALLDGTVLTNIVGSGKPDELILKRVLQLAALDDVALDQVVSADFAVLSGGQAQRVCIARTFYRALTRQCTLILLDEPTSALDNKRAKVLSNSIRELAAENFAVVAISHQRSIIGIADKLVEVSR